MTHIKKRHIVKVVICVGMRKPLSYPMALLVKGWLCLFLILNPFQGKEQQMEIDFAFLRKLRYSDCFNFFFYCGIIFNKNIGFSIPVWKRLQKIDIVQQDQFLFLKSSLPKSYCYEFTMHERKPTDGLINCLILWQL